MAAKRSKGATKAQAAKAVGPKPSNHPSETQYPLTATLRHLARQHGRQAVEDAYREWSEGVRS